jgi:hypothetical protein
VISCELVRYVPIVSFGALCNSSEVHGELRYTPANSFPSQDAVRKPIPVGKRNLRNSRLY